MPLSENNRFVFGSARWSSSTSSWWFDGLNAQRTLSGRIGGLLRMSRHKYEYECAVQCQSMKFYYLWIFCSGFFFIVLYVCASAVLKNNQCEFLLDIITHYYLLEYDFLILLQQFATYRVPWLGSFVWFRQFCFFLFHSCYCFVSLIGAPTASTDWFDRKRVSEKRWNMKLNFFWRVMVLNEHFISNSNYI